MKPFANERLQQIFRKSSRRSNLIGTNEGITIEYKQSFGWASISEYFKAMASFANRDGGYIIFGVKDKPHELLGLQGEALVRFQSIDNQEWSTNIREHFSPEIIWDKRIYVNEGRTYGIIYTFESSNKPVICKKSANELRKSSIYYRYNSQNSEIDYPELHSIIENEKEKIHQQWMKMVRQIGDSGITKTALLDLKSGKLSSSNNTLYIDEELIDEISFVKEGTFVETGGNPALVIKGQVQTIVGAQRVIIEKERSKAINPDDIIRSFIRQDNIDAPKEYIKQICYQTTGNYPIYYFIYKAGIDIKQTLELLNEVPFNSQAKQLLQKRLINQITKNFPNVDSNSQAAFQRRMYLNNILEEVLEIPEDCMELKYCILAFRSLTRDQIKEHKNYILNSLYLLYTDYFYKPEYDPVVKPEIRYAICWIDEALFMNEIQINL